MDCRRDRHRRDVQTEQATVHRLEHRGCRQMIVRRACGLLGLAALPVSAILSAATEASAAAGYGGYLAVAPHHVVPGEVIYVSGQVPLEGPPPCHHPPCAEVAQGGPGGASVSGGGSGRRWTTLVWRAHGFRVVLGRVQGHGPHETFHAAYRVPRHTPLGRVLVIGHTPGRPDIADGSVVVSPKAGTQSDRRQRLPNTGLPENDLGVLATVAIGVGVGIALRTRRVDERF